MKVEVVKDLPRLRYLMQSKKCILSNHLCDLRNYKFDPCHSEKASEPGNSPGNSDSEEPSNP